MDRELARKHPANLITERVPDLKRLPRTEVLRRSFHEREVLIAEVHKMARRGEIGPTYRIRPTERGWSVQVVRLREPGRRWRKPVLVTAGVILALGGALWLVVLALQAIAAAVAAVVPILLTVLGIVAALAFLSLCLSGSGGTTITQTVKIK
jgi:hypothetical protein